MPHLVQNIFGKFLKIYPENNCHKRLIRASPIMEGKTYMVSLAPNMENIPLTWKRINQKSICDRYNPTQKDG